MSNIPAELRYASSHEWTRLEADGTVTVGITDHAQDLLGDVVFVECPEVGREVAAGEECAVVESVKAASDIYAPISGEIIAVNEALALILKTQASPYGDAWFFKIKPSDAAELDKLMDAAAYGASI